VNGRQKSVTRTSAELDKKRVNLLTHPYYFESYS